MCLGVPGRGMEIKGPPAIVDFFSTRRESRLDGIVG